MAAEEQSRLLRLPRELRDLIYAHARKPHNLTTCSVDPTSNQMFRICLFNGPDPALLRTCKKIHDEYSTSWQKDLELRIETRSDWDLGMPNLRLLLHKSFPVDSLQSVTRCLVHIHWCALFRALPKDQLKAFRRAAKAASMLPVGHFVRLPWTPSIYMAHNLAFILNHLATLISPTAFVKVLIILGKGTENMARDVHRGVLRPLTFQSMETADHIVFARSGKLHVKFLAHIALRTDIKEVGDDSVGQEESGKLTTRSNGTKYYAQDSEELVIWVLKPVPKEQQYGSFYGFEPAALPMPVRRSDSAMNAVVKESDVDGPRSVE